MRKSLVLILSVMSAFSMIFSKVDEIDRINRLNQLFTDSSSLSKAMKKYGYGESERFKAYIVCLESDEEGNIIKESRFDYNGTSYDTKYWAASTVKLYASIAALKKAQILKIDPNEKIYFKIRKKTFSKTLTELIDEAIINSDNIAYNFLVQFCGFDYLNSGFLWKENGFQNTALCKAFELRTWKKKMKAPVSFTEMIPVYVKRGKKYYIRNSVKKSSIKYNKKTYIQTTHYEMGECMLRFIFQNKLPDYESYGLKEDYRKILIKALSADKPVFNRTHQIFSEEFKKEFLFYNKPGFGNRWYSEIIYLNDPDNGKHWILSLSDYSGSDSLEDELKIIAKIIKNNDLF